VILIAKYVPLSKDSPLELREIPFDYTPYDTSLFIKAYLNRPLPSGPQSREVSHQRYNKLESIIKAAPSWTVNTVVWNMLIKQAGVEKRYNKMFELFNDASHIEIASETMFADA
jgi:pentatricopeptide repeat protein